MLVNQTIQSLVNGVSQQPAILRLQSQVETQVNCVSSAVDGVRRRPPTRHIARISTLDYSSSTIHMIDRSETEKYAVIIAPGMIKVFDVKTGAEKTVTDPDSVIGYTAATSPKKAYRATTVGDTTFLLNREVATGQAATRAPTRPPEALIFFRAVEGGGTYKFKLNGVTYGVKLNRSDTSGSYDVWNRTNVVAHRFKMYFTGGYSNTSGDEFSTSGETTTYVAATEFSPAATGFVVDRYGSVLHIYRTDGADFTLTADTAGGGDGVRVIKGSVQSLSQLPKEGAPGFVVKVEADPTSQAGSYYVQYQNGMSTTPTGTAVTGGGTGTVSTGGGGGVDPTPTVPYVPPTPPSDTNTNTSTGPGTPANPNTDDGIVPSWELPPGIPRDFGPISEP